jgi:predicted MFS family arabinose efflux permease
MDVMTLAIAFVAIAGPSILALVLYWRNNPDRRRSWRRAAEDAADTDPEHFRRPSVQWLFFGGGGNSGGGGDSGGGSGGDGGGGSS